MAHEIELLTPFGVLGISEVWVEFNGPRLFTCENAAGHAYIGMWVMEGKDRDVYLFMAVSHERLETIRRGMMPLCVAIVSSECGIEEVTFFPDGSVAKSRHLDAEQIPKEYLPSEDAVVTIYEDQEHREPEITSVTMAVRSRREIVDVCVDGGAARFHELQTRRLGTLLLNTQDLLDDLANPESATRGRLPKALIDETQFNALPVAAGSFRIRLASANACDLFFDTGMATKAARQMVDLIQACAKPDSLGPAAEGIGPRAAGKLRDLLGDLSADGLSLTVDWGSPADHRNVARLSGREVHEAFTALTQKALPVSSIFTVHGRLTGLDTDKRSFRFHADDGSLYTGSYTDNCAEEVLMRLARQEGGTPSTATIEQIVVVVPATGETKTSNILRTLIPD